MLKLKNYLLILTALVLLVCLSSRANAQNNRWRDVSEKSLLKFDWNCATPSAYPGAKLNHVVRTVLKRKHIALDASPDRAFAFDLNGDRKPEYFVPLVCGATGNCTWGVFALSPARSLGVFGGEYIYVHRGTGRLPAIVTYSHLSAAEGCLLTYRFGKKGYVSANDNYAVGDENRFLEIQQVIGKPMPKFLERARAGCASLDG